MKAGEKISIKDWSPREISLDPYEDFIYKVPKEGDISPYLAYQLAVECKGLMDYYRALRARTNLFYLRSRSEYRRLFNLKSITENKKSVADGERKAHIDPEVVEAREKRDYAEVYLAYMEDLSDHLEKLFYLLKQRHKEGEEGGSYQ